MKKNRLDEKKQEATRTRHCEVIVFSTFQCQNTVSYANGNEIQVADCDCYRMNLSLLSRLNIEKVLEVKRSRHRLVTRCSCCCFDRNLLMELSLAKGSFVFVKNKYEE